MQYLNSGVVEIILIKYNDYTYMHQTILKQIILDKSSSLKRLYYDNNRLLEKDQTEFNLDIK